MAHAPTHRTNRYAATCTRCGDHLEPEQGYLYRGPGRDSRWHVKCPDFEVCEARRTAGFAAKHEAAHAELVASDARLAAEYAEGRGDRYSEKLQAAARRHAARNFDPATVAKTVRFAWGGDEHTLARRVTKTGASVTVTRTWDGDSEKERSTFATEAEAAAHQVRYVRNRLSHSKSWSGMGPTPTAEQIATVEAWLAEVTP